MIPPAMIFIRRLLHTNFQIDFYIYIYIQTHTYMVIYALDLMYCATSLTDEKNSSKAELEILGK